MTSGEALLETPIADLLLLGGGAPSQLCFRESSANTVTIMHETDSNPALQCKSCGYFLIITDPEYTDTECVVCKAPMPARVSSCPKCGWTYKED
jgi:hypothetical protein